MIAPSTLKAGKARPSFADMIAAAISDLKGPAKGSSRIAIKNYIKANYSDLPDCKITSLLSSAAQKNECDLVIADFPAQNPSSFFLQLAGSITVCEPLSISLSTLTLS